MSQRNRALVALGAVLVLVIAFVLLRPGDDDTTNTTDNASATTTTTAPTTTGPTTSTETTAPAPVTKPRPKVTTVRAVGLKPVGGIKTIKVNKGDTVRFTVTSDQPEHVHLHGYDVEKPVAPGKPARYVFTASIEGIFEVELEDSAVQLIKLRVDP
jgi:FtsP/CotA-like multicopper oxidase with cupredoxin domain